MQSNLELDPSIFRAYDVRGIVNKNLNDDVVYALGQAIGTLALRANETTIAVGRDGRLSGNTLVKALCKGLMESGCNVIDIGVVATPILYFATFNLPTRSGVMLTGSHNPPEYNGLKTVIAGKTLAEEDIQELYQLILKDECSVGTGSLNTQDVVPEYFRTILGDIHLSRKLKIVVDAGNGVAGRDAPELYRRLGCEVIPLFCEVDGNFPNHHPDPSQPENLQDLIRAVSEHQADMGIAFDGDGDRLGIVTSSGEIIWPDRQLIVFAQDILSYSPNATIIYDVKCTHHLISTVTEAGGIPVMWKTGHSLIKAKLKETNAALAGEMSGHIFFKDRWFGFDDAIYAGARMLEILSKHTENSADLFKNIPNSINTPELKIYVEETEKFSIMQNIVANANFANAEIITIDGLRANFKEGGWGLIRPSNTTPCLVLRFEAETQVMLENIQSAFRTLLLSLHPNLVLPF
jgi:phosphomannomutase/phosphoglucomutase